MTHLKALSEKHTFWARLLLSPVLPRNSLTMGGSACQVKLRPDLTVHGSLSAEVLP